MCVMTSHETMREALLELIEQTELVDRYPFYAAVLSQMKPLDDPSVDVMAVSAVGRDLRLHVNVDYFVAHPEHLHGVLLHEVHHVVLGHVSEAKFHEVAYPDLMRLTMEMSANEHIKEALPESIVTWRDFEQFGVRAGQSTMERYRRLADLRNEGTIVGLPTRLLGGGPDAGGRCVRGWPEPDSAGGQASKARSALSGVVSRVLREAARKTIRTGGLVYGTTPGNLIEKLGATEGPPRVPFDWRQALKNLVARKRGPRHTYQRPSRRFPARVGEIPGRRWLPDETDRPRILVAIDTSSSMATNELEEVGRQLRALAGLANIKVAECDTEVKRVYRFGGTLESVAGRGGTDLRPVFKEDFLAEHRPTALVYFTDGWGPYPEESPGVETLWVLTGSGPVSRTSFACPWGRKAMLRVEL
jgi:predicted metal-dependent peptidase